MPQVSTRVLKNELSSWVHRAEKGERIFVLRDGVPVAALVPLSDVPERDQATILRELEAQGVIRMPRTSWEERRRIWENLTPFPLNGVSASQQVLEDRGPYEPWEEFDRMIAAKRGSGHE
jgi:antitoxin (DNA-binding transcriptional repressor) of toxin-antitoxin stability system